MMIDAAVRSLVVTTVCRVCFFFLAFLLFSFIVKRLMSYSVFVLLMLLNRYE